MKTAIITYTHEGMKVALKAADVMNAGYARDSQLSYISSGIFSPETGEVPEMCMNTKTADKTESHGNNNDTVTIYCHSRCAHNYEGKVVAFDSAGRIMKDIFSSYDRILFICAVAIAVRVVAPYLKSKVTDPAVLVADEGGRFLISLLSGHIGGANEWCEKLSADIGAVPVITTATDNRGMFAVDIFAREHNMKIVNPGMIKDISGRVLNGEPVGITGGDTYRSLLVDTVKKWKGQLTLVDKDLELADADIEFADKGIELADISMEQVDKILKEESESDKMASCMESGIQIITQPDEKFIFRCTLKLVPMNLAVGIGCRRGKSFGDILKAVKDIFEKNRLLTDRIAVVASIDRKADEQGIIEFARYMRVPYKTYSSECLKQAEGEYTMSDFVKKQVGVDNVCERSAYIASCGGEQLVAKTICDGVTIAVYTMETW